MCSRMSHSSNAPTPEVKHHVILLLKAIHDVPIELEPELHEKKISGESSAILMTFAQLKPGMENSM